MKENPFRVDPDSSLPYHFPSKSLSMQKDGKHNETV
jgi:hypothetical protein